MMNPLNIRKLNLCMKIQRNKVMIKFEQSFSLSNESIFCYRPGK